MFLQKKSLTNLFFLAIICVARACSSVGRALRSQRRGHGFESHQVHQRHFKKSHLWIWARFFDCRSRICDPTDLHGALLCGEERDTRREGLNPEKQKQKSAHDCERLFGAGNQNRTDDLVITNDVLYRLSHTSTSEYPTLILYQTRAALSRDFAKKFQKVRVRSVGQIFRCMIYSCFKSRFGREEKNDAD